MDAMFWLSFSIVLARTLIEIVFFSIGASIFSFLNVIIYRLPKHRGFTRGKSMCTSCGHELSYKDMIPIISWVSLRGKCRYCGAKVSARYTVVEALGGGVAVAATLILGINWKALAAFVICGILTVVVFILVDKMREDKK